MKKSAVLSMCAAFVSAVLLVFGTGPAFAAETFPAKVKLKGGPVVLSCSLVFPQACVSPEFADNTASIKVQWPDTIFTSYETLCSTFRFEGDLLDPGEEFSYTWDGSGGAGAGKFNGTSEPISEFTSCLGPQHGVDTVLDGKAEFTAWVGAGSVQLVNVEVVLTGTKA